MMGLIVRDEQSSEDGEIPCHFEAADERFCVETLTIALSTMCNYQKGLASLCARARDVHRCFQGLKKGSTPIPEIWHHFAFQA